MKTLQLAYQLPPEHTRDVVLAQLRAKRQDKLAAVALRLWSALPGGGGR